MKHSNQKLKLLYLLKILMEKTDEEHTITVPQIIEELSKYGISAERKSIYDDLECLGLFGIDICSEKGRAYGYYIGSREFELPELKLLVDSVQSSKFITKKKSMELISKIGHLTSNANARNLQRQVFVTNRVKTMNERIYYNVDIIHEAIAANRMITFRYFDLDIHKNKVFRKNGDIYKEAPVSLTWDDENYYLITYKDKYGSYTHYRVDKMENISVTEDNSNLPDRDFDISEYAKSVFGMFGGEKTNVTIQFANELAGVVFDQFGRDIVLVPVDESHFKCSVKVSVSRKFLSWMMSFGIRAKILSPSDVVEELIDMIDEIKDSYII